MIIGGILWDDENIEHIAEHNVTPEEVEDVCYGLHISKRLGSGRHMLSGQSANGRYLNVIIEHIRGRLFRPRTAFEMSENYKRSYRRRIKRII